MPVRVLLGVHDLDVSGPEAALDDGLAFDPHVVESDRIDSGTDQFDINTRIDQGTECHVAADTGRAVEVGNPHGRLPLGLGFNCGRRDV